MCKCMTDKDDIFHLDFEMNAYSLILKKKKFRANIVTI